MRVILLVSGMDKRLRPLTFRTSKSLIPVNGEAIVVRQIKF